MESKKQFVSLEEALMPIDGLELLGDEMIFILGGNEPPQCGGSGCGCGCGGGAGCGCGCSCAC